MSTEQIPELIVNNLRKAVSGQEQRQIVLHEPTFQGHEWDYVKECLDTGWVSSVGSYVDRFERDLADYTGSPYAIAVMNGTAALHICLLLAGIQADDEVLMPSLTFVATANAVSYCSAVPHFIDVCETTMGIDPIKLEQYLEEVVIMKANTAFNRITNRRISAIVPMHTFGHPVDLDLLLAVCERYGITVIEDAAESLGSYYKGRHTGTYGKVSAISFNGNKIVTTGGGGAILTADEELAKRAKHLTTTAKQPHRWAFYHDETAYNYRMPNINAALGCAQLERLPQMVEQKRLLADRYMGIFRDVPGVKVFSEPAFATSNYWLHALVLEKSDIELRDRILDLTNETGLMTRPIWTPMHQLPMYESCPRMELPVTTRLAASVINIPSSPSLIASASEGY